MMALAQLDLLAGVPLMSPHRAAGAACGDACLARSERITQFNAAAAADFVVAWVRSHGTTSSEALVTEAVKAGFAPHDTRAFGPVFASLYRTHRLVCVGYVERTKGHGTSGGRLCALGHAG